MAIAAAILVLGWGEVGAPAHTSAADPDQSWALRIREALTRFGSPSAANQCPILFGAEIVRPDIVERVSVSEWNSAAPPALLNDVANLGGASVYAWAETDPPRIYVTGSTLKLRPNWLLAMLFHEVRGHLELHYSDQEMQRALCPDAPPNDSHCITKAIVCGCPGLRGSSTEEALEIMGVSVPNGSVTVSPEGR